MFVGLLFALSTEAGAQPVAELAPQRGNLRDLVTVQRPDLFTVGDAYVSGVFHMDRAPGLRLPDGLSPAFTGMAGVAIQERVRLDVAVPVLMDWDTPGVESWGPVRLATQVVLVQPQPGPKGADGFGLGVVPWVAVPVTGGTELETGKLAGGAFANATVGASRLTFTGQAGLSFQPLDTLRRADRAAVAAGVSWNAVERVALGLEGRVSQALNGVQDPLAAPAELTASLRHVGRGGSLLLGGVTADLRQVEGDRPQLGGFRVFVGGGFGRATDLDPDGDGILGAADKCPYEPETWNGYQDEDGCPDELANLAVVPLHEEQVRRRASVVAVSGEVEHRGVGVTLVEGLMPGEPVEVRARLECLQGELGPRRLSSGENVVLVDMKPRFTSRLRFLVVDASGVPIPGARVRWVDGGIGCSPVQTLELPGGTGTVELGATTHQVVVEAPGFAPRRFEIDVPRAVEEAVEIPLVRLPDPPFPR